jgi:hypothetical protein
MPSTTYSETALSGQQPLAPSWTTTARVADLLYDHHYLGPIKRGHAWVRREFGAICVAPPTSRRLPGTWLELTRWCITSEEKNAGSRMWAAFVRDARQRWPEITTIVSYSDPSVGHTGALYRACNWWWAPTWHRLRPPPSGNGNWNNRQQSVKDRWVFPLQRDAARAGLLVAQDAGVLKRMPWGRYAEPGGADYKTFKELAA